MKDNRITKAQITKVQTMLSKLGFEAEDRHELVSELTQGRTSSTKGLTAEEARYLIDYLNGKISPENARKQQLLQEQSIREVSAIYRLACLMGMCYGESKEDRLMNYAKINRFCRERGTVKKNVTEMTYNELRRTRKQFEAMLDHNLTSAVNKLIKNTINKKETV